MYTSYNFYSSVIDRVDREGMPKRKFGGFAEIDDLDWICQQTGAEEIVRMREEFCLGRPYDNAKTAFRIGEVIIVNASFGYHPDRRTTLFVPEGMPAPPIKTIFEKYFMKKATPGMATNIPIANQTVFL